MPHNQTETNFKESYLCRHRLCGLWPWLSWNPFELTRCTTEPCLCEVEGEVLICTWPRCTLMRDSAAVASCSCIVNSNVRPCYCCPNTMTSAVAPPGGSQSSACSKRFHLPSKCVTWVCVFKRNKATKPPSESTWWLHQWQWSQLFNLIY